MKLFELTTGFIAAVLIALGAYQYVNKTTVEEEPVVKENTSLQIEERWFLLDISDASDPQNPAEDEQEIIGVYDDEDTFPCNGDQLMCAVRLEYDSNSVIPDDLVGENVEDATTLLGADFPDSGEPYAYKNQP